MSQLHCQQFYCTVAKWCSWARFSLLLTRTLLMTILSYRCICFVVQDCYYQYSLMAYMLRPVIQDDNMSEHVRTRTVSTIATYQCRAVHMQIYWGSE